VTARFRGTTSVLFEDGKTKILCDGFLTRSGVLDVAFGLLEPNERRVNDTLARLGVDSLDAVFTGHSHYDHASHRRAARRQADWGRAARFEVDAKHRAYTRAAAVTWNSGDA
jgi:L-ascorbate metabolism protein UlaG (beta-lactamase superfamily)